MLIISFRSMKSSPSSMNESSWPFSSRGCKKFTALWKVESWFLTGEGRRGLNPGAGSSGGGRRSQWVKSDGGIDPSDPVCAALRRRSTRSCLLAAANRG